MDSDIQEWLARATGGAQYNDNIDWKKEGDSNSPPRKMYKEYLQKHLGDIVGREILDIGSGTGWLSEFLLENGAMEVVGVEPSRQNIAISRELYPNFRVIESTFDALGVNRVFDLAIAIMSFEHVPNIVEAMRRVFGYLKPQGSFVLLAIDDAYARTPRFGYAIDERHINSEEAIVRVVRPFGELYDIVRTSLCVVRAATTAGFSLVEEIPIVPTQKFISEVPRYAEFENRVMFHLYIFKRV